MGKGFMVLGTASSVGKSLLVTGLCRLFAKEGLRVAPFKSQNMSSITVPGAAGRPMAVAQAMQAEAAGLRPEPCMNPILLKPTGEMGSELFLCGQREGRLSAKAYYREKARLWPKVKACYEELASRFDLVIIEGAGSPAEINLQADDFVNLGLAERLDLPAILLGDIDRGGVFAALYGTLALLPEAQRPRIKGLVINKFRGDLSLLQPGLAQLEELCRLPVYGTLPYMELSLDEEDSLQAGSKLQGFRPEDRPLREEAYDLLASRIAEHLNLAAMRQDLRL